LLSNTQGDKFHQKATSQRGVQQRLPSGLPNVSTL